MPLARGIRKQRDHDVTLCAFDLLELDGVQMRERPLLDQTNRLHTVVSKVRDDSTVFNEHVEGNAHVIF